MGSGVDKRALELTVYDVLLENASIAEARQKADKAGYDLLGASRDLAGAEVELVQLERRDQRLKAALQAVDADYDFVLIDCPPSLSMLTLNGLCSAHGVIVPMQCEYFALEGLSDLVNTIKQVHANLNPQLEIIGLLRVMFDPRITLQQQVSDQLKAHFGDKVFNTVIPRNVRLAEAPSYGLPGVVFDPVSKGAQAFVDFAAEMVERLGAKHR
jgi:chromosome partitioning protein